MKSRLPLLNLLLLVFVIPAAATEYGSNESPSAAASAGAIGIGLGLGVGGIGQGGTASASMESKSYGFGAPSVGNGPLNCEMVIPVLGGSVPWEREACAVVRDARAIHELTPADQGRDQAVKALICQTDRIKAAFALTDRPCKEPGQ